MKGNVLESEYVLELVDIVDGRNLLLDHVVCQRC